MSTTEPFAAVPGVKSARGAALRRRLVTIPGVLVATVAFVLLAPVLGAVALLVDLVSDRRPPRVRFLAVVGVLLFMESIGVIAAGALWLVGARQESSLARHYRLQNWWASTLFRAARRILSLNLEVEGSGPPTNGPPMLLFARHASLIDSLLPAVLLGAERRLRLRWVLKKELLWDPCLDVVGNRLPNAFVSRGAARGSDAERIVALTHDLGEGEGVCIFPEGTRMTATKRERLQAQFASSGDRDREAFCLTHRHVLPPRPTGSLSLLRALPRADLWILAHTGLEGASRLSSVIRGSLIGATIRVAFWRVPASERPRDPKDQYDWLLGVWADVDSWIEDHNRAQVTA